jgi:hypothetical protein
MKLQTVRLHKHMSAEVLHVVLHHGRTGDELIHSQPGRRTISDGVIDPLTVVLVDIGTIAIGRQVIGLCFPTLSG